MTYYAQYLKYKSKYLKLKQIYESNLSGVIDPATIRNTERITLSNVLSQSFQSNILGKHQKRLEVSKVPAIPNSYDDYPLMLKANSDFLVKIADFDQISLNLKPANSNLQDIQKDIIEFKSKKDKVIYQVEYLPMFVFDMNNKIICWSWINSFFLKVVKKQILNWKSKMESAMKEISYLDFKKCLDVSDKEIFEKIMYDIMILAVHFFNGLAYFTIQFGNFTEFMLVTSIKEIKSK
jgi:hypothetical protein